MFTKDQNNKNSQTEDAGSNSVNDTNDDFNHDDDQEIDFSELSKEELISKLKGQGKTVKELRKENAKRRVENKEIRQGLDSMSQELGGFKTGIAKALGLNGNEDLKPEEKIEVLAQENESMSGQLYFYELCLENKITDPKDRSYFKYLVNEKMQNLPDNEETLPEEVFSQILDEVKARSLSSSTRTSTTVSGNAGNGKGSGYPPADQVNQNVQNGEMTVEKFVQLPIAEQGVYYQKNPEHAGLLYKEASRKGLLGLS